MKKLMIVALVIGSIGIISSCGISTKIYSSKAYGSAGIKKIAQFDGKDDKKGTLNWAYYDATKRSTIVHVSPEGVVKVLAENNPDVALASINELTGKLKLIDKVDAELALKTQTSIAELGKRTATVNLLRDALYRINEMYYANQQSNKVMLDSLVKYKGDVKNLIETQKQTGFTTEKLESLYKEVLQMAKEISIAEANAAKETEKAKGINLILANDSLSISQKEKLIQIITK